jgi:transposase
MWPFPKHIKTSLFQIVTDRFLTILAIFELFLNLKKGPFRKNHFRETFIFEGANYPSLQVILILNAAFWYSLFRDLCTPFTKIEDAMEQLGLLPLELLPPRVKYNSLFEHLPLMAIIEKSRGRPSFSQDALLKAFIYKALRRIKTLTDLCFELKNNPLVSQALGFNPYEGLPSIERFSQFLRHTAHPVLQRIRTQLVQSLLAEHVVSGDHLVLDSCPILAKVRQNNLKTPSTQRFEKTRLPKGDPDARMGVLIHFLHPPKKIVRYFWGYRNHIVADAQEELPLWEITHPADVSEIHQAIPLLRKTQETFSVSITTVSADALYDAENILCFIIEDLKAQAIIPRNPRGERTAPYSVKDNSVFCQADLPMHRKGKMTVKKAGITYLQYSCPIHFGNERQRHLLCPVAHPKFTTQKGCNALIRLTPSIRERIDYGSKAFKELQKKRTSVERIFSRLLAISMQDLPVSGMEAVKNYCTIAHITVLLIALAANRAGYSDKIRFVRSFVPNFLS